MHIGPTVHFELYWQGSCSYGDKGIIEGILLKIDRITDELYASLDSNASSQNPQRLNFKANRKWIKDIEFNSFDCRIDHLQRMILTATVLQKNEQRKDLSVAIAPLPSFEDYQTYQINLMVRDDAVTATVERQLAESAESEPYESEFGSITTALTRVGRLMRAAAIPHEEWTSMSTSELQKLFDETYEKYLATTAQCEKAMLTGSQELMEAENRAKLLIQEEVVALRRALQNRGIPKHKLPPSECCIS